MRYSSFFLISSRRRPLEAKWLQTALIVELVFHEFLPEAFHSGLVIRRAEDVQIFFLEEDSLGICLLAVVYQLRNAKGEVFLHGFLMDLMEKEGGYLPEILPYLRGQAIGGYRNGLICFNELLDECRIQELQLLLRQVVFHLFLSKWHCQRPLRIP